MTATPERLMLDDLSKLTLKRGKHGARGLDSVCVVEAVAWFAGEPHSDHPTCVSPVLGEFMRVWNDAMDDADRQQLVPLVPRLVGTAASDDVELARSYLALDWYCRVSAPAWLRLAGLTAEAEAIEATAPIVDSESARDARKALDRASKAASAQRSAAESAARSAAFMVGLPDKANPFDPLNKIYEMGCWPIGIVNDEFVVFVSKGAEVLP